MRSDRCWPRPAPHRLLDRDKQVAVRSRKEAFCLANTDAIDYTVPGANWKPYDTDLETACGYYRSLAAREVLDAGSGDTYQQWRAGQSFRLANLPNGKYFIEVAANPKGQPVRSRLHEQRVLPAGMDRWYARRPDGPRQARWPGRRWLTR